MLILLVNEKGNTLWVLQFQQSLKVLLCKTEVQGSSPGEDNDIL